MSFEDTEKVPVVKKIYGGEEALERYVKDPENFVKPEKKVGCVYKKCNRWVVVCKTKRLGSYETEEEAITVLKEHVKTLQSSL